MVSIPRVRGVTSRRRTSFTSPAITPPWIAAPSATASSGLTERLGSLPKKSFTTCWTLGIRVIPPTRITSAILDLSILASDKAFLQGSMVFWIRSSTSSSSLEREIFIVRWRGWPSLWVIKGWLISVSVALESSILAFSAESLIRWSACLSRERSTPDSFLNSETMYSIRRWSKSSPPRKVSPLVDLTSKTPSPSSRIETSKVPPPRS